MYVDSLRVENLRTFREAEIALLHPARTAADLAARFPTPVLYPNINLVLGDNGSGKSTFLKALALACLGPVAGEVRADRLVRREPNAPETRARTLPKVRGKVPPLPTTTALVKGVLVPSAQDGFPRGVRTLASRVRIDRKGDYEKISYLDRVQKEWHPIYSEESDALFFVGYGANRRSEDKERFDPAARKSASYGRVRRVMSLFDESYSLVPLSAWLPRYQQGNKGRFSQVMGLLKKIVGPEHWTITEHLERGEYLFRRGEQTVPFPALSDGYRAFYGWLSDLLYHVCVTAPAGKKLVENQGVVMIDEIDLHLHPSWQLEVLPRLSAALPNIQFVVTTHSPLVVGSIQWMNLIVLEPGDADSRTTVRKPIPVHGLDADQVLLTPFFALPSSRTDARAVRLKELSTLAGQGDSRAASQLLLEMSRGSEARDVPTPARKKAPAKKRVAAKAKEAP